MDAASKTTTMFIINILYLISTIWTVVYALVIMSLPYFFTYSNRHHSIIYNVSLCESFVLCIITTC